MSTAAAVPTIRSRFSSAMAAFRGAPATAEKGWLDGGGGYALPSGGFIPSGWDWQFWQRGRDVQHAGPNAIVHACVDAYAQTIASLKARHISSAPGAGKDEITTSALSRILHRPNEYQSRSDFVLNQIKALLLTGNAYAVGFRNERGEVAELHLVDPRTTRPMVEPESREVFYGLGDNPLLDEATIQVIVPARDMLHVRLYTPRHPLVGVTPVANLAASIASSNAIASHTAAFYNNMARPSGILKTSERLTKDQMAQLRLLWQEQSTQLNSGGIPILAAGLEWQSMAIDSQDAQTVEAYRMSVEDIARAFRVPLPLIGDTRNSNYNSTEQLVSMWMAMGLGFLVEHVERAYDRFFRVPLQTQTEFDVDTLMRSDFAGRIDGLTKGITGGLYSPNEARRREGLKDMPFGDEPRVQQQVVPLSQIGRTPEAPPAPPAPPPAPSADERAAQLEQRLKAMLAA